MPAQCSFCGLVWGLLLLNWSIVIQNCSWSRYIGAMIVDTFPVTNSQYEQYLQASGDRPSDTANWLKQNFENGKPTPGWEDKPVTYVSLDDARLYCAYHNKRLPHAYLIHSSTNSTMNMSVTVQYRTELSYGFVTLMRNCGLMNSAV